MKAIRTKVVYASFKPWQNDTTVTEKSIRKAAKKAAKNNK